MFGEWYFLAQLLGQMKAVLLGCERTPGSVKESDSLILHSVMESKAGGND